MPSYLTEFGRAGLISPVLTALNLAQLPASVLLLVVARRLEGRAWPFVATGLMLLICVVGMALTASVWTIVFAAVLGFTGAIILSLALTLPAILSAPEDVARTSAAMFTVSYATAMLFSVLSGIAWDLGGDTRWAFLPVVVGILPQILLIGTIRFPRPT
jgi:CP family cyanate transporter-like MFS transporter